jgi:hypothetical protein
MPNTFEIVTDPGEIAKLNSLLGKRLEKVFRHRKLREITYPAGHFTADVYFEYNRGSRVRAWAPKNEEKRLLNFILSGDPNASSWMEISVQLNFPAGQYNRRMAGAFIKDSSGEVLIGHRGKLTKGRAALKQRDIFREFSSRLIEAQDGNSTSNFILISGLDAPDLAERLWDFAIEAREAAKRLGAQRGATEDTDRLLLLRKYYDEFAGITDVKGHGDGTRTVEHGDVVKALEAQFAKKGITQKAQAIDLTVVCKSKIYLFEVKTSACTTAVYTGVGQLLIHGESISERFKIPVDRYLVLPGHPNKEHARHIIKKGHMQIITYRRTVHGYRFDGV